MKSAPIYRLLLVFLLAALMLTPALAQSDRGSIAGFVGDTTGGALAAARITLEPGGMAPAFADGAGQFIISGLKSGTYTLTASSQSPIISTNSGSFDISNSVPSIVSLTPPWAVAGDAGFALTVNGANFVYNSAVRWNGSDRATTYVSPTQITAAITDADIASLGLANVTVFNPTPGGGPRICIPAVSVYCLHLTQNRSKKYGTQSWRSSPGLRTQHQNGGGSKEN